MSGYILSILGIVVIGVVVDVIIPTGTISKFIKSIYGIFVVLIIVSPIINIFKNLSNYEFTYNDYEISENLFTYISNLKVNAMQEEIIKRIEEEGLVGAEVSLKFSIENDNFQINSCVINTKNMTSSSNSVHINRYEIITEIVKEITNLNSEVILFDEWERGQTKILGQT